MIRKDDKKVNEENKKIYKEANKSETETTINVLYGENILSVYTNKVELEKQLYKIYGNPTKQYKKGKSILASMWEIPLSEKTKISKMILKANIFEL
ncbi:MAG: hypothetical protein GX682_02785 [Clostridiaceae bacterium]|nr:hypothetical protein [Clostridiaceae bacterium]